MGATTFTMSSRPMIGKRRDWHKKLFALLKTVKSHKFAWVFEEPVDTEKLNVPDYFEIVKNPMCLQDVKEKIETGTYNEPTEFLDDINLICDNAMTYNPPDNDVYQMARELKEYFEKKWEHVRDGIVSKYQEEMLSSAVEISASDKQAKSSQMKRDRTGLSVKRIIENEKFDNSTPLKVDEKKTLSANMNKLPCKKLGKIVEIIHARHPTVLRQSETDPDEITVDLDEVDPATIRFLIQIVDEALAARKRKQGRNGDEQEV